MTTLGKMLSLGPTLSHASPKSGFLITVRKAHATQRNGLDDGVGVGVQNRGSVRDADEGETQEDNSWRW